MSLPTLKVNAWGWRMIIFASVFAIIFYAKLWQPQRQVELHQKNFLLALEDRRWRHVRGELAEDYADRFGHDRESVVKDLTSILRQFFVVSIRSQGTQIAMSDGAASVTTNITLTGTGPGVTDLITSEVNRLPSPWIFKWRKASLLPWDWELENVDNASLVVRSRGEY